MTRRQLLCATIRRSNIHQMFTKRGQPHATTAHRQPLPTRSSMGSARKLPTGERNPVVPRIYFPSGTHGRVSNTPSCAACVSPLPCSMPTHQKELPVPRSHRLDLPCARLPGFALFLSLLDHQAPRPWGAVVWDDANGAHVVVLHKRGGGGSRGSVAQEDGSCQCACVHHGQTLPSAPGCTSCWWIEDHQHQPRQVAHGCIMLHAQCCDAWLAVPKGLCNTRQ